MIVEPENIDPKQRPNVTPSDAEAGYAEPIDVRDSKPTAKEKFPTATGTRYIPGPYRHLLGFAVGYGLILFFCPLATGDSFAPLFPLIAFTCSTVFLVALWSVFGPGSYLKRLFWAHLIGAIPALALALGVMLLSFTAWDGWIDFRLFLYATAIFLISIAPISLGAQLPFWFFRFLFGWQLVYRGDKPNRSFDLRDVFVVTFVFALCFAVPQMAVNLESGMYDPIHDVEYADLTYIEEVAQPDGSYIQVERTRTVEDAEKERREMRQSSQMASYAGYARYVLMVFLASLLSFPVVLFVFRTKEIAAGCGFTCLYVIGLCMVPLMITSMIFGGARGEPEILLYGGFLIALIAGGTALPLLASRETGFQLTSPKRFEREQTSS